MWQVDAWGGRLHNAKNPIRRSFLNLADWRTAYHAPEATHTIGGNNRGRGDVCIEVQEGRCGAVCAALIRMIVVVGGGVGCYSPRPPPQ